MSRIAAVHIIVELAPDQATQTLRCQLDTVKRERDEKQTIIEAQDVELEVCYSTIGHQRVTIDRQATELKECHTTIGQQKDDLALRDQKIADYYEQCGPLEDIIREENRNREWGW